MAGFWYHKCWLVHIYGAMPYLIDGHNLIGQFPDISLFDPNDEAQLVQKLAGFVARTQKRCVVVFDQGLPGGESRLSTWDVKVIFASHHSNADHVIMERIKRERNPKAWTVVSNDNDVLSMARRYRMDALRSSEFIQLMKRPPSKLSYGEGVDIRLSDDEVEEWMRLFGAED